MMTRKEAAKMAMDIDGHMNDNSQGIDLSWDSIEKLVNEAYAKGATEEREACARTAMELLFVYIGSYPINEQFADAIRARGQK